MPFSRPFSPVDRLLRRGLELHERRLGSQTFTWKGAEIPCSPSSERRGLVLSVNGGFEREVQLSLIVRRENFPTADLSTITADATDWTTDEDKPNPTAGRKLTFRGNEWRILSVTEAAGRSHFVVDLGMP